jgi:hypothetical protein
MIELYKTLLKKFYSIDKQTRKFIFLVIAISTIAYTLRYDDNDSKETISRKAVVKTPSQIAKDKKREDSLFAIKVQKRKEDFKKEKNEENEFLKSKAGKIWKKHPEWSKEDCKLLAENKFWIGMQIQMVVYLRGRPNSATPSDYGNGVQWQWCWHGSTPSCFYDNDNDGKIDAYN